MKLDGKKRVRLAAMLCAMGASSAALGANKNWSTNSFSDWSIGSNWSPNGMPSSSDHAYVGFGLIIHDAMLNLDMDPILSGLTVSSGMFIDNRWNYLTVNGDTTVTGDNAALGGDATRLWLRSTSLNPYELMTHDLTVSNGAGLELIGLARVFVSGQLLVDAKSRFQGAGIVNLTSNGSVAAIIDGDISIDGNSSLTFNQLGAGRIDLDGGVAGDQIIALSFYDEKLIINGDQLTDAFDDTFWIGNSSTLSMNLSNGWTLGNNGNLVFLGDGSADFAKLTGGTMTVAGTIETDTAAYAPANVRFECPAIFNPSAQMNIEESGYFEFAKATTINGGTYHETINSELIFKGTTTVNAGSFVLDGISGDLNFDGNTTINGGSFDAQFYGTIAFNNTATVNGGTFKIDAHSDLDFNGVTHIKGGTFNTPNDDTYLGVVRLNGATDYQDTVTFNGAATQNGPASVNAPAVIHADTFDLDGESAITAWSISAPLTINATSLNEDSNVFTGSINLVSTPASSAKLIVNLTYAQSWVMAGGLKMTGSGFGTATDVIAGSDVKISGPVTVNFDNAISARANFASNTTTINSGSSLRLDGGTLDSPNQIAGATFSGAGALKSSTGHALEGYGTINTPIVFAGGNLHAKGGTLNVNGAVTSVGVIGPKEAGVLKFSAPFNTSVASRLELDGGSVVGFGITNAPGKQITGNGEILSASLNNNGTINPGGGQLTIDTTSAVDLDGSTEAGKFLVNTGAQLWVMETPADPFNGSGVVQNGGYVRFDQSWTLGSGGMLTLNGNGGWTSIVSATNQTIAGTVLLPINAQGAFTARTSFASSAVVATNTGSKLTLAMDSTIPAGASFTGGGTLYNAQDAKLVLDHGANVGIRLINDGSFAINATFPSAAIVHRFTQHDTGSMSVQLWTTTLGTGYDRLDVTQLATLGGTLNLFKGLGTPAYLSQYEIIHSDDQVEGVFATITGNIVSPTKYFAVTYDSDRVMVTTTIPGDCNIDGDVDFDDLLSLAQNYDGTQKTWSLGDFTGNGGVTFDDLLLLAQNYGFHLMQDDQLGRDSSADFHSDWALAQGMVPEPTMIAGLLAGGLMLRRKR